MIAINQLRLLSARPRVAQLDRYALFQLGAAPSLLALEVLS
jgi:hypothetical protein